MIKNILKFSLSNLVNMVIGLFSAIILTRVFVPEVYGVLNIFNTTVATGLSILYLGLDSCYIRFYNEPPDNTSNKQLGTKLLLICIAADILVGSFITFFFSDKFTMKMFGFASRIICALIFISIFAQIILRFFNIKYRMEFNSKSYNIQAILTQIMLKLFVIVAALMKLKIEIIVLFNVAGVFILTVVFIIIQGRNFFSFKTLMSFDHYSKIFKFAVFSAPLAICINLNNSIVQQFISRGLSISSVGIYSSAGYFVTIFNALQGGFATYWSAYMYANYKEKQTEIKKVNEFLLLAIIIAFSGMILGKDIIYLLIGKQYHESKKFFSLVLCYPMLMLAAETTSYGITLKNKNHLNLLCFVVSVCVNLVLAFILIPVSGLRGAAFASMISSVVLYLMRTVFGQKLYSSISNVWITVVDVIAIILISVIPSFIGGFKANLYVITVLRAVMVVNKKHIILILHRIRTSFSEIKKFR